MIPTLHYISQGKTPEEHLDHIQKACTAGAELVQLRLKKLPGKVVWETAKKAREITEKYQTRLIINDFYKIAAAVKADGVHLGKTDTCPTVARKELSSWQIIGGTANTLEDCETLIDKNVDYIGLGPFRFTETKENLSPVLGLNGYLTILEELKAEIPVIAIGGIVMDDVTEIMKTCVHGIAVSGEITRNFNTISEFKKLINGGPLDEQRWISEEKRK
ncbi:thiamine phosphate synthase [Maribacter forsetii]|uniref:thiamine phosphate synthase n=1 Tax=Maribacter forsetii TaxID=444515 RepID=UPI00056C0CC0|nr:thiamine phosphate synthase [Maribacter forsetii]